MKIATWNLDSLRKLTPDREAAFRQAMTDVDADVWVLTETWANFTPSNGYLLAAESSAADDLKKWPDRRWVAIWVKSNLDAEQEEVQRQQDRMTCARIKRPGYRDIVVVGTVLPWPSDDLWRGTEGFCAALEVQMAEWDRLRGTPRSAAFSVAGDFNQSLPHRTPYGSKMGESALQQALVTHDLVCLTEGNDPQNGEPRIDHICISCNSLNTPPTGTWTTPCLGKSPVTDHSGVYVDIDVLP